jgi:23S rRNA pseudouridine1911/1915/1917 synthase
MRVDKYLSRAFPFLNRTEWKQRIQDNELKINYENKQRDIKPTYKIKPYDEFWFLQRRPKESLFSEKIECLFDNGDICAFNKPPGLVIHQAGMHVHNTVLNLIKKQGYGDCYPVHRIDKETSGIVLTARKMQTRKSLSLAFATKDLQKMYLAIVKSKIDLPASFQVNLPIGKPEDSKIRLKLSVNFKFGKEAMTNFFVLSSHKDYYLLACFPLTGRTNQIRVHLSSVGAPIVGDKMYHSDENTFLEYFEDGLTENVLRKIEFKRQILHNAVLSISKAQLEISCPISKDIQEGFSFWEKLSLSKNSLSLSKKEGILNAFQFYKDKSPEFVFQSESQLYL